jgi:glycosyltransferase involved in cell wall biosynthesis
MLDRITPVILTLNEAPNIARTLGMLHWAKEVVVLDSGSTDSTAEIARSVPNVRFWSRPFDNPADQWNAAVSDPQIPTEWVLALDADYIVPPAFVAEARSLSPADSVCGFRAHFNYAVQGTVLRASLYPPHVVLFRRTRGRYVQDGHTQRLLLEGPAEDLRARIIHDDRKPFSRWLASQRRYARQEGDRLRALPWTAAGVPDVVRKSLILAPWVVPAYILFGRGVVLDGWRGLRYAAERAIAEIFIARALISSYFGRRTPR